MVRLPKAGIPADQLKCKVCAKKASEQDNDIKKCSEENCPFKKEG